ncbi:MAG: hypothetical protein Q8P49_02780 [Candidatus Liptonbacteria bacterium]|nr:hypothetical protein [Candidatus Liptonbacteria bacterium]
MKRNERGGLGLGLILAIAAAAALLICGMWFYGYINGLRSEGVQRETTLSAQYLSNQNYLSSYISGFYEQLGVVQYKSEKLDQILADYAKGRRFGADSQSDRAGFINAVAEAVPDLKGLDIADRMMDYVAAGREGYRTTQDKLLDMLRSYDNWRADGIVQSWVIEHMLSVPTKRLEARIGDQMLVSADARNKMWQIVLASDAKKAYESGVMEPLKVTPPPTKN